MPKLSEAEKTARREHVLAGARRCFARYGYDGATVVRLEQEIGLSRGAIFNWFASKEDLFLELATRDNDRITRTWIEDGMEAAIRGVLEEDPDWLGVYLGVAYRLRTDAAFRKRWDARAPKEQEKQLVARMREQQAAGELRADLEPEQIGRFIGVLFDGIAVHRAAGYDPPLDVLLLLVRDALGPVRARTRARRSA
jgi:TetR/AcrR family transcriptional regulator, transcriptional repressor of aconitase